MLNFLLTNPKSRSLLKKIWTIFSQVMPITSQKLAAILLRRVANIHIDKASETEIQQFKKFLLKTAKKNKSQKTVLILSIFPFKTPRHGGQIRCYAIAEQYRKAGYLVIPFIVRNENHYVNESIAIEEVIFPVMSLYRLYNKTHYVPHLEDYFAGVFAENDPQVLAALVKRIHIPIDIIQVEHPWLFGFAVKAKNTIPYMNMKKTKLIYSAHNTEYKLKEQILKNSIMDTAFLSQIIDDIKNLEIFAANQADLIQAVSLEDKQFLETLSPKPVIYTPNAAYKRKAPLPHKVDYWKAKLPPKFFVFVASAHPPNLAGLVANLNKVGQFFDHDLKIVIVGSINLLIDCFSEKNTFFPNNQFLILGVVDDEDLDAILFYSHAILIPITMGGGTNLKTAEALLSGKFVVATKMGMRGFEDYQSAPGVYVSEDPLHFQNNMRKVWNLPASDFQHTRGPGLTWDYSLKPLIKALG